MTRKFATEFFCGTVSRKSLKTEEKILTVQLKCAKIIKNLAFWHKRKAVRKFSYMYIFTEYGKNILTKQRIFGDVFVDFFIKTVIISSCVDTLKGFETDCCHVG